MRTSSRFALSVSILALALPLHSQDAEANTHGSVDYLCEDGDDALTDIGGDLFCADESDPFVHQHSSGAAFGQGSATAAQMGSNGNGNNLTASLAPLGSCATPENYTFIRDDLAGLTIARIDGGEVARFWDGCYTVNVEGTERTFEWNGGFHGATIDTTTWVRTLPRPYAYTGPDAYSTEELGRWLDNARAVSCDDVDGGEADVLALAFEYDEGSDTVLDMEGQLISSDADYGKGADFHDYLGIAWTPPDRINPRQPDPTQYGTLDCSGYIRLVWGYRENMTYDPSYIAMLPLTYAPAGGTSLSRNSWEMYNDGVGRILIPFRSGKNPNFGAPTAEELALLQVGDIVFFDSKNRVSTDYTNISHMGIFVGTDSLGNYRFISSRDSLSGPTMGDNSVWSVLNQDSGHVYYSLRFRAARRF